MNCVVTLTRDMRVLKTLDVSNGPVTIGRFDAILKRKLDRSDAYIPRCAARLEVDPLHAGTLLLTNPHDRVDLNITLPDTSVFTLRPKEAMVVPTNIILWDTLRLTYNFRQPSIFSQETDDGEVTEDEEREDGQLRDDCVTLGAIETQPLRM